MSKNKLASLSLKGNLHQKASFLVPGDIANDNGHEGYNDEGATSYQGRILNLSGIIDLDSRISVSGTETFGGAF